jgi:hypothetical protein
VLLDLLIVQRLFFLLRGGVAFFELKQAFVVLADLLCHNDLLALAFFLDVGEHLLARVQEDLLEVLHIALNPLHRLGLKFRGFFLLPHLQPRSFLREGFQGRAYF